tara:strand:+ start:466 stop:603 length:138 start_codon:yes stop_codon:yes gene_type:complete
MNTTTIENTDAHSERVELIADKAFFFIKMSIAIAAIILVEVSAWI